MLSVLHLQQQTESDCLPVCAQMILSYLGFGVSYTQLVKLLGTQRFGTSFWNIKRLEQLGATVTIDHLAFGLFPIPGDEHLCEYLPWLSDPLTKPWEKYDVSLYEWELWDQWRGAGLPELTGSPEVRNRATPCAAACVPTIG